ncbi:MAG TPA: hypothetical protein PLZ57_06480 [Pseudobdellovibrionaceae bacterium]|nr:hypothetical protein [Pseudobdellovibrionaceae bacterium]
MKQKSLQISSGSVAQLAVDLFYVLIFGILAALLNPSYFLLAFGVVIFASTFEFQWPHGHDRPRVSLSPKLKISLLANLGWSLSAMVADWQSLGAGSRVLGRVLGTEDWSAGLMIVHTAHLILLLALLSLLELGIKSLCRALREFDLTSKPQ